MSTWFCRKCCVSQVQNDVKTVEITEPGKGSRVEYHGRIRPEISGDGDLIFSCLVCGNVWGDSDGPDGTPPGGASITPLYPVTEDSSCCADGCAMCEREDC